MMNQVRFVNSFHEMTTTYDYTLLTWQSNKRVFTCLGKVIECKCNKTLMRLISHKCCFGYHCFGTFVILFIFLFCCCVFDLFFVSIVGFCCSLCHMQTHFTYFLIFIFVVVVLLMLCDFKLLFAFIVLVFVWTQRKSSDHFVEANEDPDKNVSEKSNFSRLNVKKAY